MMMVNENNNDDDSSTNVIIVPILKLLAISTFQMHEKKTDIVKTSITIIHVSTYSHRKIRNEEYG